MVRGTILHFLVFELDASLWLHTSFSFGDLKLGFLMKSCSPLTVFTYDFHGPFCYTSISQRYCISAHRFSCIPSTVACIMGMVISHLSYHLYHEPLPVNKISAYSTTNLFGRKGAHTSTQIRHVPRTSIGHRPLPFLSNFSCDGFLFLSICPLVN